MSTGRSSSSSRTATGASPASAADAGRGGDAPAALLAEGAPVVALVVRPVLARADRLPPRRVVAVPGDGLREPVVEAHARLPAECAHLVRGQGVAAVVAGAVRH